MDVNAPGRRFITRVEVEDAARDGKAVSLGNRDVITDEAAQRARDLSVTVTRQSDSAPPSRTPPVRSEKPDPSLRSAVRDAVIAELGDEPTGLHAALDKVFGR